MNLFLKEFRQNHGKTQKQMGEIVGIDQQQWQKYEKGLHEFPIRYLLKLCEKMNVTPNEVLGFDKGIKRNE